MATKKRLCIVTLTAAVAMACSAQEATPFVFGEVRTFRSSILGQDRTLNVYLPDGYAADSMRTATYPVIYVLDGSANEDFPHIAGLAQYMNMYDLLPQSIVVGIANVDRRHDFTYPTHSDSDLVWVPTGGGSAPFIAFLEKEVQPFVVAHYRTNSKRTIIGQSLGGLLCTEILFKRPELFDDYVIVSPSLWWDNGSLAIGVEDWAKAHATMSKRVFIAMARDDDWSKPQVDAVLTALGKYARPPFLWTYVPFPEETHATILHRGVYRAFELLSSMK
ncbi:MAG: alpha/beta hydrolase-fold protein [Flavobacteriales bacterium]